MTRDEWIGEFASKLGADAQHRACLLDGARAHNFSQPSYRNSVNIGFEFRPTVEPIRSREHQLRIVQGERGGVCVMEMRADFRDCIRFSRAKRLQQFLGLAFELFEIGLLTQGARGQGLIHNELLSIAPGVRSFSGRKEFIKLLDDSNEAQGDAVLPADTGAP